VGGDTSIVQTAGNRNLLLPKGQGVRAFESIQASALRYHKADLDKMPRCRSAIWHGWHTLSDAIPRFRGRWVHNRPPARFQATPGAQGWLLGSLPSNRYASDDKDAIPLGVCRSRSRCCGDLSQNHWHVMRDLGLTPSEDSSGERRRQGAITKTGNTHARCALVEHARKNNEKRPLSGSVCLLTQGGLIRSPWMSIKSRSRWLTSRRIMTQTSPASAPSAHATSTSITSSATCHPQPNA
jgi:Transposase IS116/IS110/IS902 family